MGKYKYGRHIYSFMLLFLTPEPAYGSILLQKIRSLSPDMVIDSAAVYRALNDLEKEGSIKATWDMSEPGPAKKWYAITPAGLEKLAVLKADVEKRKSILDYFLTTYAGVFPEQKEE